MRNAGRCAPRAWGDCCRVEVTNEVDAGCGFVADGAVITSRWLSCCFFPPPSHLLRFPSSPLLLFSFPLSGFKGRCCVLGGRGQEFCPLSVGDGAGLWSANLKPLLIILWIIPRHKIQIQQFKSILRHKNIISINSLREVKITFSVAMHTPASRVAPSPYLPSSLKGF